MNFYLISLFVVLAIIVCDCNVVSINHRLAKDRNQESSNWQWLKAIRFDKDDSRKEREAKIRNAMEHQPFGKDSCTCEGHKHKSFTHKSHESRTTTKSSSATKSRVPMVKFTLPTKSSTAPTTTSITSTTTTTSECVPSPYRSSCTTNGNCTGCLMGPINLQTRCINVAVDTVDSRWFIGECLCSLANEGCSGMVCCDGSVCQSNGKCPPAVPDAICLVNEVSWAPSSRYGICGLGGMCGSDERATIAFGKYGWHGEPVGRCMVDI